MYRRIATFLLIAAALLLPLLASSCAVSASRLSRPPPVLLLGGDAGARVRGGRSREQGRLQEARETVGRVRRLGQRTPVNKPPSTNPHGMATMVKPVPPPPPPEIIC